MSTVANESLLIKFCAAAEPYQLQEAFTDWLCVPLLIDITSPVKLLLLILAVTPSVKPPNPVEPIKATEFVNPEILLFKKSKLVQGSNPECEI